MTILDTIAESTRERVADAKRNISFDEMREMAFSKPKMDFPFEAALKKPGLSLICECKKASPSKGVIAQEFPYLTIAREYEEAGADAISVLTEPKWFLGCNEYLKEIANSVNIPVLRKDFTVDEYMIYEARVLGASAVLLIVSILTISELKHYKMICDELGLSALVEAHSEAEIENALKIGARIIGMNNRNLKDFSVDTGLSIRLRDRVPKDVIFVAESGIRTPEDAANVAQAGADALLVGEMLMRSSNKRETIRMLRNGECGIQK